MKLIKTALVALCIAAGVTNAGECGNVTKKTYGDNNCKTLIKEETLPGKDSRMCQNPDNSEKSYKISCDSVMYMYEYPGRNCTGEE